MSISHNCNFYILEHKIKCPKTKKHKVLKCNKIKHFFFLFTKEYEVVIAGKQMCMCNIKYDLNATDLSKVAVAKCLVASPF